MKCLNHRKNPPDLQTKRTFAKGKEVVRDRYCPKCKKYIKTIEQFESDILKKEELTSSQIQAFEDQNQTLKESLENIKDTWKSLNKILGCK